MTEDEQRRWGGLCVVVTGLVVSLKTLRAGDLASCDQALNDTLEAATHWTRGLENRKRRRSGRVPAVGATALAAMYQRRREADTFGGALLALLGRAAIETEREGWGQR